MSAPLAPPNSLSLSLSCAKKAMGLKNNLDIGFFFFVVRKMLGWCCFRSFESIQSIPAIDWDPLSLIGITVCFICLWIFFLVIWNLSEIEDGRSMNPASCFYLILLFPLSQQFQWPKKWCTHTHLFLLVYATTWRKSGGKERKWPLILSSVILFSVFEKWMLQ